MGWLGFWRMRGKRSHFQKEFFSFYESVIFFHWKPVFLKMTPHSWSPFLPVFSPGNFLFYLKPLFPSLEFEQLKSLWGNLLPGMSHSLKARGSISSHPASEPKVRQLSWCCELLQSPSSRGQAWGRWKTWLCICKIHASEVRPEEWEVVVQEEDMRNQILGDSFHN